jgi:hypothetical protein
MSKDELINHIRSENPSGLGRPYSIKRLIFIFGLHSTKPKRISDVMRCKLGDLLEREGIDFDTLLKKGCPHTRLFVADRGLAVC